MMRRVVPYLLAALVTLVGIVPGSAQSPGTPQGTIAASETAIIPGASIPVRHPATGIERAPVSDGAGHSAAASLPPGHYQVVAHLEGFQDQTREVDLAP